MNIETSVLDVLSNAVINESTLKLVGQLDRKLYVETNKVLEAAGGKWNRKAQAHVFEGDASSIMDQIILTGKVTDAKQEFGFFETPPALAETVMDMAYIRPGLSVLEPSAGLGALAFPAAKRGSIVDCIERQEKNARHLDTYPGVHVWQGDFLAVTPTPIYDRVVMNPPFAKQADIRHVTHAFKFLKTGGLLVAIMSAGVRFRTNKLTADFRQLVQDKNGTILPLPEDSFKESGTGVNTVIVTLKA